MAGTPSLTSMAVFMLLALLILYHAFDRVTDLVGHSKAIEAAAAECPLPPGPVQRDLPLWRGMHAAFVEELRAAQNAMVCTAPNTRGSASFRSHSLSCEYSISTTF